MLPSAVATTLAEAWARDGLMEHASVASFSRFALALLAHGAPSELIEEAHHAALDEVHHAELCFALASRYAGATVEPSSFPVAAKDRGITLPATLADLAEATVREGCIGETIAALVATEQLATATDNTVRSALSRIAEDEARHAELAFRVVAWALSQNGADRDEVRARVASVFEALPQPALPPAREGEQAKVLRDHGRLDSATVARVTRAALSDVITPCAAALLRATRAG